MIGHPGGLRGSEALTNQPAEPAVDPLASPQLLEALWSGVDTRLEPVLDAARLGIWRWCPSDQSFRSSTVTAELFGFDPDAPPIFDTFISAIHSDDRARVLAAMQEAATSGAPYVLEFRCIGSDGAVNWILSQGQLRGDGSTAEMIGISLDVTERRLVQDERTRLAERQGHAAELAVRMQIVTAGLSEATTVQQVRDVLLDEGRRVMGARSSAVSLLSVSGRGDAVIHLAGEDVTTLDPADLTNESPLDLVLRTGQPLLITTQEDMRRYFPGTLAPDRPEEVIGAAAVLPLLAQKRPLGVWMLAWAGDRSFEEGEIIILLSLAAQCGLALNRAQVFERERAVSTALQRTLLPERLPVVPGLAIASRYRPGAAGVEVGGDWYDVIPLPRDRVAFVVGDVGGHDIDAAAVMGQVRNAVRSYAWEGHPAATVLEATNRLLCGMEPGVLVTCCYVELNLEDGIASVALAGHPPPLVQPAAATGGRPPTAAAYMAVATDPPLGTDADRRYEQSSLFLAPGDSVALYTDGLIETRHADLSVGMNRLRNAAESEEAAAGAEALAEALVTAGPGGEEQEDDIALLVLQYAPTRRAPGDVRSVRRHLPSSPMSAGVARRFAADVVAEWGVDELVDVVTLGVSELMTNALIHTAAEVELALHLNAKRVRVEVIDQSDRLPVMRSGSEEETSGRGLHILEAISADWGFGALGSGKSVWFELIRPAEQSGRPSGTTAATAPSLSDAR